MKFPRFPRRPLRRDEIRDRANAAMDRCLMAALKVEGFLEQHPDNPDIQEAALQTRSAVFFAFEAGDRPFTPFWTRAIPFPPPSKRRGIDYYLCSAPERPVGVVDSAT